MDNDAFKRSILENKVLGYGLLYCVFFWLLFFCIRIYQNKSVVEDESGEVSDVAHHQIEADQVVIEGQDTSGVREHLLQNQNR